MTPGCRELALRDRLPKVADRPALPGRWQARELFAALARECKKLLKVLW